jgi:poly(hydroxyalkanoate) depolymerase family esterase
MKIGELWTRLKTRSREAFRWSRWRTAFKSPFRGGFQAALAAWRERWRKPLPNDVSHTFHARGYPGSRTRLYRVHVPGGNQDKRPLVVVLHGCRQDNRDIETISGFNRLADRHGFLVAYPFVTSYRGMRNRNCWGWWFEREIHAGAGEVQDLWQIVEEIRQRYPVDEQRIHVTGLSSGAGMAVAMMVVHGDRIASGAAVAGVPYAEKAEIVRNPFNGGPRYRPVVAITSAMKAEIGEDARSVPIQVVHSENDDKVEIRAAHNLRDSWGLCFGIDTRIAHKVDSGSTQGTDWEHSTYHNGGRKSVIETLFLQGPGHGWYGGNPGAFSYPEAPDISRYIWDFFDSHPLE